MESALGGWRTGSGWAEAPAVADVATYCVWPGTKSNSVSGSGISNQTVHHQSLLLTCDLR